MRRPRLIEQWLPVNEVSTEGIREGSTLHAGHPPVNQLHVWWARRPLIASRAAIAASVLPTDADRDEFLANIGTSADVVTAARQRDAAKAAGERPTPPFPNKRAFLHNPNFLIDQAADAPLLLDVTAGGGSIPFEAGRLGLRTVANELNPVAAHILRATCEWPQRYGFGLLDDYREVRDRFRARLEQLIEDGAVYPAEQPPDCAGGECPHPEGLCEIAASAPNQNGSSNKNIAIERAQRYAQTYLWARSIHCPACACEIPLSPNWRLDNKGTGIRLEPATSSADVADSDAPAGVPYVAMRIVHEQSACPDCRAEKPCALLQHHPDAPASPGTVARAIAACPACGATTPKGFLAQEARAGRMGHRLYCVVYRDRWRRRKKDGSLRKDDTTCLVFVEPSAYHFASDARAVRELERLAPEWEAADVLPGEALPMGNKTKDAIYYGMPTWREMFNPRQQLAHGYCVRAFRECVDADRAAGRLDERRKAAWSYVAIALDKMINRNNLMSRWEPKTSVAVGIFDSHDFGFKWSYAEMAITLPRLGLEWALNDIEDCLSQIIAMAGHVAEADPADPLRLLEQPGEPNSPRVASPAEVMRGDARDLPLEDASVDCVVFDPPYEDNVCYAELSDFFYVWLKRTAGYVFPDDFADYLTEKDQEAIASPIRFRRDAGAGQTKKAGASAKQLALADYQAKMAQVFAECRRVIKPDGVMTVMFNHKSTAAWDALTVGLIEAGFAIVRTWPVKTEAESSLHIRGRAAARTTILLACRPRQRNPNPAPWHEVEALIAEAVRDDIADNLSRADLRPIDLYLSAFGPALRVISEHWGSERESANPDRPAHPFEVTPTDALQVARREVSRHRSQEISREWHRNPVDPATKFYILAKDAAENDVLLFDEANLLARALGVALEKSDPAMRRIIGFKSDKVTLLSARDRLAAQSIGEDGPAETVLDAVHTAVALTDRRNTREARQWLARRRIDADDTQFRATLEALIRTAKPGHDDYQPQRHLWRACYQAEPPPPLGVQLALALDPETEAEADPAEPQPA